MRVSWEVPPQIRLPQVKTAGMKEINGHFSILQANTERVNSLIYNRTKSSWISEILNWKAV